MKHLEAVVRVAGYNPFVASRVHNIVDDTVGGSFRQVAQNARPQLYKHKQTLVCNGVRIHLINTEDGTLQQATKLTARVAKSITIAGPLSNPSAAFIAVLIHTATAVQFITA